MIGMDLKDTMVLRRSLEDLEAKIPKLKGAAIPIIPLSTTATDEEISGKIEELVNKINLIISALDETRNI